jgi:spore maturation protein CgeB
MRITLFGSKDYDSLEYNLNDSLVHLGHSVCHLDINDIVAIPFKYNFYATKFIKVYDEFVFKKVANRIIDSDPELIICVYRFINPLCIKLIKSRLPNVKRIHINPDAVTTFQYQQIFASPYDAFFTKDQFILDFMKNKMGLNTFYLPEAFNPRVHKMPNLNKEVVEQSVDLDVITFGSIYPYRANMVRHLINSGIKVQLFGTPDKRFGSPDINQFFGNEYITGKRKSELIFGSKVVFNNFHYAEVNSANVKFFEIAGIGGFQICDYKPCLEEYSIIPTEKFTFNTIGQAIDLIKFYLDKPVLRHELAHEQYNHFLSNHTYEHRINQMFNFLQ